MNFPENKQRAVIKTARHFAPFKCDLIFASFLKPKVWGGRGSFIVFFAFSAFSGNVSSLNSLLLSQEKISSSLLSASQVFMSFSMLMLISTPPKRQHLIPSDYNNNNNRYLYSTFHTATQQESKSQSKHKSEGQ